MSERMDEVRADEAPVSGSASEPVSDPPRGGQRGNGGSDRHVIAGADEPADSTWKAWAVRLVLTAVLLGGVFLIGRWVGRATAPTADGVTGSAAGAQTTAQFWTCSMHPQIRLPAFGQCPICFMDLIPETAGGGNDSGPPVLTLSPRARQLAKVETTPVRRRELTHEVRMVGKVVPDERQITYISSYIPGRIERLFVNYTGILVRKGDHLAEIYSPDLLVTQREYLLALEAHQKTQARADADPLAVQSSAALLEAARRKLELLGISKDIIEKLARDRQGTDHIRIDSPLEGWVLERQGYEGMYVETGTRIFTLADLRSVWVLLDAYELDIGYIHLAQPVQFETEAYPGEIFEGTVAYIDPVLRPETRTVKVRVNVQNPDLKLRPEMFVRARLKARLDERGAVINTALAGKWICYMHPEVVKDGPGTCDLCGMDLVEAESLQYVRAGSTTRPAEPLAVPASAVLLTGERAVVYVEREKDGELRYEGRVVRLGPRGGDYYVVLDGLHEGERVVTRGALMIDSALQIQAQPSMMAPDLARMAMPETAPADHASHAHHASHDVHNHAAPASAPASAYVAGAAYHAGARSVLQAYFELVARLAADDAPGAHAAIREIRAGLADMRPEGLPDDAAEMFRAAVETIRASLLPDDADIEAVRERLPQVTRAVEDYLQRFGHDLPESVREAYCSMAFNDTGAAWLQAGDQIRNPYFGRRMLRCGEIRARIAADGRVAQ